MSKQGNNYVKELESMGFDLQDWEEIEYRFLLSKYDKRFEFDLFDLFHLRLFRDVITYTNERVGI